MSRAVLASVRPRRTHRAARAFRTPAVLPPVLHKHRRQLYDRLPPSVFGNDKSWTCGSEPPQTGGYRFSMGRYTQCDAIHVVCILATNASMLLLYGRTGDPQVPVSLPVT